jgi:iron complex outermembrane receptor protein
MTLFSRSAAVFAGTCSWLVVAAGVQAQVILEGKITANGKPLPFVSLSITPGGRGAVADSTGSYRIGRLPAGSYTLTARAEGYGTVLKQVNLNAARVNLDIVMVPVIAALQEVVVTGVAGSSQLRRSPVPVVVVKKDQLNLTVNYNIVDAVAHAVPGVSAVTTGPNISKPFIRGLGYNRVLTLYDGIRQEGQQWGDEHGIEIDPYGVERVEVVKGPASIVYGSDALAGVVNMIPALPSTPANRLKGDVSAEYQTNNGMTGASLGLYYRHKQWQYGFRTSGKWAHDYRNPADGYVYGTGYREHHIAATAAVSGSWGSSKWGATLYNNLQEIPDGSRDSLTRRFTYQVAESGGDDIKARPLVPEHELTSYKIVPLHQHIQHYRLYNSTNLQLGKSSLSTLIAVQQSIRREYNHPTQPEQAGLYVVLNTLSYDMKYSLPQWKGIAATIGVNGMYQANRSRDATDFPIPDYNLFDAGVFVLAKKTIGKLDISGGIRYDHRHVSWKDFYTGTDSHTGFSRHVFPPDTTGAFLQFPAFDHVYSGWSASLGATYAISNRVSLKGNIARGYRSPNITEIGSNGLDPGAHIVYLGNRDFKPEFSFQQDLGVLAYLEDMDISFELFHNHIQHYIYQARLYDANGAPVVIVPGNTTYAYQQSAAALYGAEITLNLHPRRLRWFSWNNSLAYTEGRNKNAALLKQYGAAAKYLPFIPPLHGRSVVQLQAVKPHGWLGKPYGTLGLDLYASQHHFYGADHTETFTPGYVLVAAGIGTVWQNKEGREMCRIALQADNLFNAIYQSHLSRLKYFEYYSASPNGRSGIYNMGRNISAKLIIPF